MDTRVVHLTSRVLIQSWHMTQIAHNFHNRIIVTSKDYHLQNITHQHSLTQMTPSHSEYEAFQHAYKR